MTPYDRYQQDLAAKVIDPDPAQEQAVLELQRIYEEFCHSQENKRAWKTWLGRVGLYQQDPCRGLYLWGGVGIGKTYLMDLFYHCLQTRKKTRLHFHSFMRKIHQQLAELKDVEDPLVKIAEDISRETDLLCFDEFFVVDIGDAMILARLLEHLFSQGVVMIATSNVEPSRLYEKGLQRELFLPAIALIKKYLVEFHLATTTDYRLQKLTTGGVYFYPLNDLSAMNMRQTYSHLVLQEDEQHRILTVNHRPIKALHRASQVIWFDFNVLCAVPRSQQDYLVIAQEFHTVLLSNVPKIEVNQESLITYLIYLVDIFYDAKVKLIMSAQVSIDQLYTQGRRLAEFQRTQSRLLEMGSKAYLCQSHSLRP